MDRSSTINGENLDKQGFLKEWENVLSEEQINRLEQSLKDGSFVKTCREIFVTETGGLTDDELTNTLEKFIKKEAEQKGINLTELTEKEKIWNWLQQNWELVSGGVTLLSFLFGLRSYLNKKTGKKSAESPEKTKGSKFEKFKQSDYFNDGKLDIKKIEQIEPLYQRHKVILDLFRNKFIQKKEWSKLEASSNLEVLIGKKKFIGELSKLFSISGKTEGNILKNLSEDFKFEEFSLEEAKVNNYGDTIITGRLNRLDEIKSKGVNLVSDSTGEIRLIEFGLPSRTEIYNSYLDVLEELRNSGIKGQELTIKVGNLNLFIRELFDGDLANDFQQLYKTGDNNGTLFREHMNLIVSENQKMVKLGEGVSLKRGEGNIDIFFNNLEKNRVKDKINSAYRLAKIVGSDKLKEFKRLRRFFSIEESLDKKVFSIEVSDIITKNDLDVFLLEKLGIDDISIMPHGIELDKIEHHLKTLKTELQGKDYIVSKGRKWTLAKKFSFDGNLESLFKNSKLKYNNIYKSFNVFEKIVAKIIK